MRATRSEFASNLHLARFKQLQRPTAAPGTMLSALRTRFGARPASSQRSSVACASGAGKRILITGGNTGIGYEAALALLRQKYEVTLACRDADKSLAAKSRLEAAVPGAVVSTVPLDLSDLSSVRECATRLLDQEPFDVVLNNAGVMACPKMQTKDGFEYQLGVNHLGHFLLTSMLLPQLLEADKPVRIVNVASAAHQFGTIDFNDLMRDKKYDAWKVYGQSKLANICYTYELARRLQGSQITVNCLHPGVVRTELGRYMVQDSWFMPLAIAVAQVFFLTPEQGARTSVYLASSPEVSNISGKYFVDSKPTATNAESYNTEVCRRLYEVSQELTKAPALPPVKPKAIKQTVAA